MKVAIVTGANKGLGLAVCKDLGKKGYTIVLTARNPTNGEEALKQLKAEKIDAHFFTLDVTQDSDAKALAAFVKATFGTIDVLVNNAGIFIEKDPTGSRYSSCATSSIEVIQKTMDANTFGALRVAQALIPLIKKGGRIVNVSSGMGALTDMSGGSPGYRLSKVAMNAITRMLAVELQGNILVNSVCPGWVRTDMGGANAARSLAEGSASIVWAAELESNGPTGGFFRDGKRIDW